MNIKELLTEDKVIQTKLLFNNSDQKVIALRIKEKEILKEHLSKVPALLICISGELIYQQKGDDEILLRNGDYVFIPQEALHELRAKTTSDLLLIK